MIQLTSNILLGLSKAFLQDNFDDSKETPACHIKWWDLCCDERNKFVDIAAPRGHAKSTAITFTYALANLIFGVRDFLLIVSDTESQSIAFLKTIKKELQENDGLQQTFKIKKFVKDTETKFILELEDGREIIGCARGAGQSLRGVKEGHRRPNLIVIDDLENEDIVATKEARSKLRDWFFGALIPMGSTYCLYRMVGTVLHNDALLERLQKNPQWVALKDEAHNDDMSYILWPERFPKKHWIAQIDMFKAEGKYDTYLKEYRNKPVTDDTTYYRKQDFQAMDAPDWEKPMVYYAAADYAIEEKQKSDYTVFGVMGVCSEGKLYLVDVRKFKKDTLGIIEEMFSMQERYKPEIWAVETMMVEKTLAPILRQEMVKRRSYMNIEKFVSSTSKIARARGMQARMKAGACYFDKEADWYDDFESELLQATEAGIVGAHDDQFDMFGLFGRLLDKMIDAPTDEEIEEEVWLEDHVQDMLQGRNNITGY